jgi:hypothetical protein
MRAVVRCKKCKSTKVHTLEWIRPNVPEIVTDYPSYAPLRDPYLGNWCEDCDDCTKLEKVKPARKAAAK